MDDALKPYPGIKQAIGLTIIFLILTGFFGAILQMNVGTKIDKITLSALRLVVYIIPLAITILIGFNTSQKEGNRPLKLKFNRVAPQPIFIAIVVSMCIPFISSVFNLFFPESDFYKKILAAILEPNFVAFFSLTIAAPILEETLFRGIILDGFLKKYTPQKATLISALIFGLAHLNPWQAFPAFLLGILIGYLYSKTNSIIPGIIIHSLYNCMCFVISLNYKHSDVLKTILSFNIYITAFAIALIVGCVTYLDRYFRKSDLNIKLEAVQISEFE